MPFVFDNNRMFVDLAFVEPDGSLRKARAFVNQGSGSFVLTNKLYRELGIGEGKALRTRIGTMEIATDPRAVQPEDMANSFTIKFNPFGKPQTAAEAAKGPGGSSALMAAPMNVEAVLPPSLLANFVTVFDYGTKTLTLAAPGMLKPEGVAGANPRQSGHWFRDARCERRRQNLSGRDRRRAAATACSANPSWRAGLKRIPDGCAPKAASAKAISPCPAASRPVRR